MKNGIVQDPRGIPVVCAAPELPKVCTLIQMFDDRSRFVVRWFSGGFQWTHLQHNTRKKMYLYIIFVRPLDHRSSSNPCFSLCSDLVISMLWRLIRGHFCSRSSVKPNWAQSRAGFDQLSSLRGCGYQIPEYQSDTDRPPTNRPTDEQRQKAETETEMGTEASWAASAGVAARRVPTSGTPWSEPEEDRRFGPIRFRSEEPQAVPLPRPLSPIVFGVSYSQVTCTCVRMRLPGRSVYWCRLWACQPAVLARHPARSCGPGRSWAGRHCNWNFPTCPIRVTHSKSGKRREAVYLVPQKTRPTWLCLTLLSPVS